MTFGSLHKLPHPQSRVTASSTTAGLACYGYIKRSTVIDKLSLRLGEGGSCVNITYNDVKHDTNPFVNPPLVKLRYQ